MLFLPHMDEPIPLIVLADDPLARAGLAALLAHLPGVAVVAQAATEQLGDAAAGAMDVTAALIVWDAVSYTHLDVYKRQGYFCL